MKIITIAGILTLVLLVSSFCLHAEDADPATRAPAEAAKEYIAKKYNCDVNELTIGSMFINNKEANIDVNYNYGIERVYLKYNDADQCWEAEDAEFSHQY